MLFISALSGIGPPGKNKTSLNTTKALAKNTKARIITTAIPTPLFIKLISFPINPNKNNIKNNRYSTSFIKKPLFLPKKTKKKKYKKRSWKGGFFFFCFGFFSQCF